MSQKRKDTNNDDYRIDYGTTTDIEIEEWILTTRKVLIVLADEDKDTRDRVYQDFVSDLERLKQTGRITDTDYENILGSL